MLGSARKSRGARARLSERGETRAKVVPAALASGLALLVSGVAAATAAAMPAATADAVRVTAAEANTVVVHRLVAPGTYDVTVDLSSPSAADNHVTVTIGTVAFHLTMASHHRHATRSTTIEVLGRHVTVRASAAALLRA